MDNFKSWARKSRKNSVYASVGEFSIMVPMHVYIQNLNSNRQEELGGFKAVGGNYNYSG